MSSPTSGPQAVPSLPPTGGIADPHVRAFCDALANAWSVRNNGVGKESERFVRKGEIGSLASDAMLGLLSGSASIDVQTAQPGSAYDAYQKMVQLVQDLVLKSAAYQFLSTPIALLKAPPLPTKQLNDLLSKINAESAARVAAIEAEAALRGSGVTNEQTSRISDIENLQSQITTIIAASALDSGPALLAAIEAEQSARIAADTAEATNRLTLVAQLRGEYTGTDSSLLTQGLIYSEQQARVTAVGALAYTVTSLSATVGDVSAQIVDESTTRATADSAMASSISAMTSTIADVSASIYSESTTRATADTAMASSITTLFSSVGSNTSAISSESTTRLSKDTALAQAINTIWASIGGSLALIQDGALAAVSPAAVSATKWTQVQAAVTDPTTGLVNSASIKGELDAYASAVDGTLNATWGIRANVNGVISGVTLMTSAGAGSAPGTATSDFLIMADRLSLVNPSNTALHPVPFSVDGSGNAVFTGTVYAAAGVFGGSLSAASGTFDGTVTSAATVTGTLTAAKIAVGTATGAVVFFDPTQPTIYLHSTANGTFNFNGTAGVSTLVPATCYNNIGTLKDPIWDYAHPYDCSYYTWAVGVVTGTAVKFANNDASYPISNRIKTGDVTFTVISTATADHYFSLWYRRNGGTWQFIYMALEPQHSYGSVAAGASLTLTIYPNDVIEFGMSPTNSSLVALNPGSIDLLYSQLTVLAKNF